MESTNKKDKFAVAVFGHKNSVVGHLMNRKSGRFVKAIFYFLPASEYHRCKFCVTGKAVNQGDNKGMKYHISWYLKDSQNIFSLEYGHIQSIT